MAKNPLFSTYRQGENRVTSSMLAVFERIDLTLLERLLAQATGESRLQTVTFVNQPQGQGSSVPDGRISAHFAYWFEVETATTHMGFYSSGRIQAEVPRIRYQEDGVIFSQREATRRRRAR